MGCGSIFKVLGPSGTPVPTDLCVLDIFDRRDDHNVFEENLRLAKQSPADRRGRRSLQSKFAFHKRVVEAPTPTGLCEI